MRLLESMTFERAYSFRFARTMLAATLKPEGRPIMYLFEDSGGVLPVHTVGVSMTGAVPQAGKLGLHWIAEMGNGRSSNTSEKPVQNFYSDRNYKAFNLAAYIKPEWLQGLQIGGSYYHDQLAPTGLTHVDQNIASGYVVYLTPTCG
jgi:hypothetical protein